MSDKRVSEMSDGEIRALAGAADPVASELAAIKERFESVKAMNEARGWGSDATNNDGLRLVGAVEAVLRVHKIEPLYAHADDGECGCPVPTEHSGVADDVLYEGDHPEGFGLAGYGLVCRKQVVGSWCLGCADVAVEHGCFEVPKAYPPEQCQVRRTISPALLGKDSTDEH